MKRCVTWMVLALAMMVGDASAQTPLRIARIENIPDQFVGGEILKAIYTRANIPMELVDLPAKRAIMDSSQGVLDGEVHRNIKVKDQYPTLIPLQPGINYIEPSVFSKNLDFEVKGWESLKDYRIGIVRGVGTSEDGTKGMPQVTAVSTLEQLMQMLAEDRIDVAVSDAFSGLAELKRLKLDGQIHLLTPPLQKVEIYHYLHEKHRDLIPTVEKVIQEMQASGELEQLRAKIIEQFLSHIQ